MSTLTAPPTPVKALSLFLITVSLALFTTRLIRLFTPPVLGTATQTISVTYSLLEGWNLVHFPVSTPDFNTATDLVRFIAQKGGYVTTIATWADGRWQEYIHRGDTPYSPNFPIKPGTAYFLRNHSPVTFSVSGTPVTPSLLKLQPGWNSLGLPLNQGLTASQVLTALNPGPKEMATEIDRWLSGNWQVFVKRIYAPDNIQEYGDNFPIATGSGYMIKATDYLNFTLTE